MEPWGWLGPDRLDSPATRSTVLSPHSPRRAAPSPSLPPVPRPRPVYRAFAARVVRLFLVLALVPHLHVTPLPSYLSSSCSSSSFLRYPAPPVLFRSFALPFLRSAAPPILPSCAPSLRPCLFPTTHRLSTRLAPVVPLPRNLPITSCPPRQPHTFLHPSLPLSPLRPSSFPSVQRPLQTLIPTPGSLSRNEQLVASNRTVPLSFSSLSCITAHRRSSSTLQRTSQQYLKSEDSEEVGGAAMDVDMDVAEMGLDAGDPHPLEKLADSDFFNKFEDDFEDEDLA
ncbi:unnamed protein product [Closterium sp. NIES-54]